MHPRTQIRNELKGTISAIGGMPNIYVSRVRDLNRNEQSAVLIYTTNESIRRPAGAGEARPGMPLQRDMQIEIVVMSKSSSDSDDTAASADDLCRQIEIAINNAHPSLELNSIDQGYSTADAATVITTMRYNITYIDELS